MASNKQIVEIPDVGAVGRELGIQFDIKEGYYVCGRNFYRTFSCMVEEQFDIQGRADETLDQYFHKLRDTQSLEAQIKKERSLNLEPFTEIQWQSKKLNIFQETDLEKKGHHECFRRDTETKAGTFVKGDVVFRIVNSKGRECGVIITRKGKPSFVEFPKSELLLPINYSGTVREARYFNTISKAIIKGFAELPIITKSFGSNIFLCVALGLVENIRVGTLHLWSLAQVLVEYPDIFKYPRFTINGRQPLEMITTHYARFSGEKKREITGQLLEVYAERNLPIPKEMSAYIVQDGMPKMSRKLLYEKMRNALEIAFTFFYQNGFFCYKEKLTGDVIEFSSDNYSSESKDISERLKRYAPISQGFKSFTYQERVFTIAHIVREIISETQVIENHKFELGEQMIWIDYARSVVGYKTDGVELVEFKRLAYPAKKPSVTGVLKRYDMFRLLFADEESFLEFLAISIAIQVCLIMKIHFHVKIPNTNAKHKYRISQLLRSATLNPLRLSFVTIRGHKPKLREDNISLDESLFSNYMVTFDDSSDIPIKYDSITQEFELARRIMMYISRCGSPFHSKLITEVLQYIAQTYRNETHADNTVYTFDMVRKIVDVICGQQLRKRPTKKIKE